ncbi:hypothetical protein VIGAN_05065500 [Vigna angularis var. angularis]|uniref:DUF538 domain-containing protein n=2 Tax=Phaseolus angularis TaxID=3914 RepID=A0A0S3S382_PHAAN|nr:hypothetical protein VIGAN_05065500 [Vigna angularis var. angularis]
MTTTQIAHHRDAAEIYKGEAVCKQKSRLLLDEILLPRGLLPLDNIVEMGYNRTSGFVWLKQKHKKEHRFTSIGRTVSYDTEVTAFVEEHRMRRVTGVKTKELFLWVTISEIFVEEPACAKISFANSTGISRSFPLSAFSIQDEQQQHQHNTTNTAVHKRLV